LSVAIWVTAPTWSPPERVLTGSAFDAGEALPTASKALTVKVYSVFALRPPIVADVPVASPTFVAPV
jgi:hypothetical protein